MLVDAQLLPLLAASSFPLNRLVLEVTEHTSVSDYGPSSLFAKRFDSTASGFRSTTPALATPRCATSSPWPPTSSRSTVA